MKRRMTAGLGLIAGLALALVPVGLATPGAAGAGSDRTSSSSSSLRELRGAATDPGRAAAHPGLLDAGSHEERDPGR